MEEKILKIIRHMDAYLDNEQQFELKSILKKRFMRFWKNAVLNFMESEEESL